jgi:hypothetical protein
MINKHTVPRNLNKVERLFQGMTIRYMGIGIVFLGMISCLIIGFFDHITSGRYVLISYMILIFIVLGVWGLFFRTNRILDRTLLFIYFYIYGAAGKNKVMKHLESATNLTKLLNVLRFYPGGNIKFTNGVGRLYIFDSEVVVDNIELFNIRAQTFLNSLRADVIFKIEIRIETEYGITELTQKINNKINNEKDSAKREHLKSIYEYSKEKEENDFKRSCYFFVGIETSRDIRETVLDLDKLEMGLKPALTGLDCTYSRIRDKYTLYEFYKGVF